MGRVLGWQETQSIGRHPFIEAVAIQCATPFAFLPIFTNLQGLTSLLSLLISSHIVEISMVSLDHCSSQQAPCYQLHYVCEEP